MFKRHIRSFLKKLRPGNPHYPTDLREDEFLITFDDALEGVYEYAYPIMDNYGIKGIVFVIVNFIGKKNVWDANFGFPIYHMNEKQIIELSDRGWVIGSHGVSHRSLEGLNEKEILYELEYSKKYLEDLTGRRVEHFAYPFGICSKRAKDMLMKLGYRYAYCGISKYKKDFDRYSIPRIPIFITDIFIGLKLRGFSYYLDRIFTLPSKLTPIYHKLSRYNIHESGGGHEQGKG